MEKGWLTKMKNQHLDEPEGILQKKNKSFMAGWLAATERLELFEEKEKEEQRKVDETLKAERLMLEKQESDDEKKAMTYTKLKDVSRIIRIRKNVK